MQINFTRCSVTIDYLNCNVRFTFLQYYYEMNIVVFVLPYAIMRTTLYILGKEISRHSTTIFSRTLSIEVLS